MPRLPVSSLIASIASSVDEAAAHMKKRGLNVQLEEVECSLTIEAEVDTTTVGSDQGLFVNVPDRSRLPIKTKKGVEVQPAEPQRGTLTLRAVIQPGLRDD